MGGKPAVDVYPGANEAWASIPAAAIERKGKGMP